MSSRTSVRDLPEVQPFWLSPTVIERNAPLDRGAVAKRLRGRSLYFLLFCRVKREAENPFEIETHGSTSPQDTPGPYRTALAAEPFSLAIRKTRRSLNARWILD